MTDPEGPSATPEARAQTQAPAAVIEARRVDLAALLGGTATPEDILVAADATRLGIEARGRGELTLARKLYERALAVDSPTDYMATSANLCDLDRLEGHLEEAHRTADRGLAMARHLAGQYKISLEEAGVGHDDPERGAMLKAFWFAFAKLLNFKALTFRAQFNRSGVGDERDYRLLEQSTAHNEQALRIAEMIGHGYRNKVIVDLLADRLESNDPAQWTAAIEEAGRYLFAGGLDPNRQHNFHSIQGTAYLNSGKIDEAVSSYRSAYEVSEQARLKREAANDLVCMVGALCLHGRSGEAATHLADLDARLDDLAVPDIAHQKRFLLAIHAHHPLPEQFVGKE